MTPTMIFFLTQFSNTDILPQFKDVFVTFKCDIFFTSSLFNLHSLNSVVPRGEATRGCGGEGYNPPLVSRTTHGGKAVRH